MDSTQKRKSRSIHLSPREFAALSSQNESFQRKEAVIVKVESS